MASREQQHEWEVLVHLHWARVCPQKRGAGGRARWLWSRRRSTCPGGRHHSPTAALPRSHPAACEHEPSQRTYGRKEPEPVHAPAGARCGCVSGGHRCRCRARQARLADHWREHAPESVATVQRDGTHTLVLDKRTGLDLTWRRTTSLLERTTRDVRCTGRQVVTFASAQGAEAAIYLHVRRLHSRWRVLDACRSFPQ
jgi:hypothetical protein